MKSLAGNLKKIKLGFGVLFLIFLSSCMKETIDLNKISNTVDWPVAYGTPVAYGSFSLKDMVSYLDKQGQVVEDSTGLLYLLYHDTIFSQKAEDLLTFPNQSFQQQFTSSDSDFPPLPSSQDSIVISRDVDFTFPCNQSDAEIDSIFFKSGTISLNTTTSNFLFNYKGKVTFLKLIKNGVPLSLPFGSSPSDSIAGYKLLMENSGVNKMKVRYDVVIYNHKSAIGPSQTITTTFNISSAKFSKVFGYLGQMKDLINFNNTQDITIDFYSDSLSSGIRINNPTINFYVHNSFGVPLQVKLSNTRTYSEKTKSNYPITLSPDSFLIKAPSLSQIGQTVNQTVPLLSNDLSNAMATAPHHFYYDMSAITNPQGNIAPNFFLDTSKLSAQMELKLPFDVQVSNLRQTDTIDFDLSKDIKDFDVLKKVTLYNTFKNGIPFKLNMQVFLMDSAHNKVDSLYRITDQPIVPMGDTTQTRLNKYTAPKTLSTVFDKSRIKNLEKVRRAIIVMWMSTPTSKYMKFYSGYRLDCAFQVQTELEVHSLNQF
jgi:hypothetical protein